MNYEQSLEYIHGISWTFCKPGLERISRLCEALGHPERELKFVHVAGTNGKGSFSCMLESVLRHAGYKTGLYTSPYIKEFGERMRVMGENIPNEKLAEVTSYVRPIADAMEDKPTEFELITAIAFEYFKRCGCEIVVLEAGMGGRLDSTNVIRNPLLSVITGIALDHTAFLGDTVEKIAAEKAGIIKDGAPVLFGGTDEKACAVIRSAADERGSELYTVDYGKIEKLTSSIEGSKFDFGEYKNIEISLAGLYQPKNAASVLTAIDILRSHGLEIPEKAVRAGLLSARWPARFEVISKEPLVIFDGAHNPEGVSAAVESIKHYFGKKKIYVLSGVLADKDHAFIAKKIAEVASRAYTITPDNPRALSSAEYAAELQANGVSAEAYGSIREAFLAARNDAKSDSTALVCLGSLYTYVDISRLNEEI